MSKSYIEENDLVDNDPIIDLPIILDTRLWLSENPALCHESDGVTRRPLMSHGLRPIRYDSYQKMGMCEDCPRKPYKSDMCVYRRPKNAFNERATYNGCAGESGYSEEVLMDFLIRLWRKLGHPPSTVDINNSSAPSASTYARRYGGLASSLAQAQIASEDDLPEWDCPYCGRRLKSEKGWKSHTASCKKKV